MTLFQAHENDRRIPLDPELYVASQPISPPFTDPWTVLAHPDAARRYVARVRKIISRLRSELQKELRRAEALINAGHGLPIRTEMERSRLSPLGLYIAALRSGRVDLAIQLSDGVVNQHRGCPLYRFAALSMIPADSYPVGDETPPMVPFEVINATPGRCVLQN
ncbi:hypothetical protein OJF2_26710 [Aquisphaera giovannonii]|uniref:Uncharacterized protein n=1 Tax=Aquisphaera giovannonii TaxID=406548 RepID=A0A5B9W0J9_9BACT|nr:hypothetical protein [Aquisphaera giovannonii]QEH34136.1 hypothetical protein OJF2_26710 [Aquisphaera giovannonii]